MDNKTFGEVCMEDLCKAVYDTAQPHDEWAYDVLITVSLGMIDYFNDPTKVELAGMCFDVLNSLRYQALRIDTAKIEEIMWRLEAVNQRGWLTRREKMMYTGEMYDFIEEINSAYEEEFERKFKNQD